MDKNNVIDSVSVNNETKKKGEKEHAVIDESKNYRAIFQFTFNTKISRNLKNVIVTRAYLNTEQ